MFPSKQCLPGFKSQLYLFVDKAELARRTIFVPAGLYSSWGNAHLSPAIVWLCRDTGVSETIHELGHAIDYAGIGMGKGRTFLLKQTDEEIRSNVETNFLGPLFLARAYAPLLSGREGATIIRSSGFIFLTRPATRIPATPRNQWRYHLK